MTTTSTSTQLQQRIGNLSATKRALLRKLADKASPSATEYEPIPRRQSTDNCPLSFAQERLWTLNQFAPRSFVHNLPAAVHLLGILDIEATRHALDSIVARHESLRTTFKADDGIPVQVVNDAKSIPLCLEDLSAVPAPECPGRLRAMLAAEARRPFNLSHDMMLRAALFRLAPDEHVLLVTMHHIAADGWSMAMFFRELSALYGAYTKGSEPALAPLPIQYTDYTIWQRQWLRGDVRDRLFRHWRQQLDGNVQTLQLPTDRARSDVYSSCGARVSIAVDKELTQGLKALCRRKGVTLYMALLAAFKTFLHTCTGQSDMIVCSPLAGRNRKETERLIGYFDNIVALRTDLSGNPTFCELLGRVRRVALDAFAHQDLPFQTLTEIPTLARVPLSRALFALQNSPSKLIELPDIAATILEVDKGTSDFDVSLLVEEKAETLRAVMEYKKDLFNTTTITELLNEFVVLLESIVADPSQRIGSLNRQRAAATTCQQNWCSSSQQAREQSEIAADDARPHDSVQRQLIAIWQKILGTDRIGLQDNFFDLGGDSLRAARLFVEVHKSTGRRLPLSVLLRAPTVAQLADLLRDGDVSECWSSLVPLQTSGSKLPFFCVHPGGGNVLYYRELAQSVGPDQPFYGLQSRGLNGKSPRETGLEKMAAHYLREIRAIQPEGPYFLGGLCFGGVAAFEMAQQLHAQEQEIALLALFDTYAPSHDQQFRTAPRFRDEVFRFAQRMDLELGNLVRLGPREQLPYLVKRIRNVTRRNVGRVKNWARRLHQALWHPVPRAVRRVQAANRQAAKTYEPRVYPGRMILFRASKQPAGCQFNPHLGWTGLAAGGIEVHETPGYHNSIATGPRARVLATQLKCCLATAQAEATQPSAADARTPSCPWTCPESGSIRCVGESGSTK